MWCSDLPIENALRDEKLGKEWSDFHPNERVLTFAVPVYDVKFHQN